MFGRPVLFAGVLLAAAVVPYVLLDENLSKTARGHWNRLVGKATRKRGRAGRFEGSSRKGHRRRCASRDGAAGGDRGDLSVWRDAAVGHEPLAARQHRGRRAKTSRHARAIRLGHAAARHRRLAHVLLQRAPPAPADHIHRADRRSAAAPSGHRHAKRTCNRNPRRTRPTTRPAIPNSRRARSPSSTCLS